MEPEPNQPRPRRTPWWLVPAGVGLGLITFAATVSAIVAFFLFLACPLIVCGELSGSQGVLGILALLGLWGAYALGLAMHPARRIRRALAIGAAALFVFAVAAASPLDDRAFVAFGLFFGLISHGMLLIALASARHSNRLVDADRWIRHRLARGRCPRCGYDIRHLPQRCCPECGTTWSVDELGGETGEPAGPQRLL